MAKKPKPKTAAKSAKPVYSFQTVKQGYDPRTAQRLNELAAAEVVELRTTAAGTAVTITREGYAQLRGVSKRENPANRKQLDYLRSLVRRSCGAKREVKARTREVFDADVSAARGKRDTARASVAGACDRAREATREAKGKTKPRTTGAERVKELAQLRDAEARASFNDPADWATWKKSGGGRKWTGPRWKEQFEQYLHDEGTSRYQNIETPDDSEFAEMERQYYARQKRA